MDKPARHHRPSAGTPLPSADRRAAPRRAQPQGRRPGCGGGGDGARRSLRTAFVRREVLERSPLPTRARRVRDAGAAGSRRGALERLDPDRHCRSGVLRTPGRTLPLPRRTEHEGEARHGDPCRRVIRRLRVPQGAHRPHGTCARDLGATARRTRTTPLFDRPVPDGLGARPDAGPEPELAGADLSRADLAGANLVEADLTEVALVGTDLTEARLSWVDLI
ncbi:pentapeptide repeat-containing protein [Streptomyces ortus]|uniref:pentapeptide repeat-containing protein n=1 Tax=Streptomyces ortus TaxID=2867268 RepID=UPI0027E249DF|nr:pentapeptide repeat-containing protein [Streptomyces ortus]